jgi:hypothetical protein
VSSAAAQQCWIVNAPIDIAWFILPVLTGYLCLYVNVAFGVSSFLIWWFWQVAVNGPHFYATISRTYLDREEWRHRRGLLIGSLLWFTVGPLAIWVSIQTRSMAPFIAFWVFQVVWAYCHVVRQHYGFMALYQKLNGEPEGAANKPDYWIFHVLMLGPVVAWFLRYPDFRSLLGWTTLPSAGERVVLGAMFPLIAGGIVLYAAKEFLRFWRTGRFNLPKSALLVAYVPFHLLLLLHPTFTGAYDILLFNAAVTFPHNLQYVAIVWFHNRNRYRVAERARDYGVASPANGSLARFAFLGIAFSIVVLYTRFYFEGQPVPFALGRYAAATSPLGGMFRVSDLVAAAWIGLVFHHQYLDQRIWKISCDRTLNRDLGIVTTMDRDRALVC